MSEQNVKIPVNDQVTLRGGYTETAGVKGGAMVLHPHPLYGGSMHNNVVEALVAGAVAAGWSALRFNFRGAGGSSGQYDEGRGEQDDVIAAADWLRERSGQRLALLGYSFGSLVGANAAARLGRIDRGLWVAPPLVLGPLAPWPQDAGPLVIVVGEGDEFTQVAELEAYIEDMGARGSIYTYPGLDHFWWGRESALIEKARALLQDTE